MWIRYTTVIVGVTIALGIPVYFWQRQRSWFKRRGVVIREYHRDVDQILRKQRQS